MVLHAGGLAVSVSLRRACMPRQSAELANLCCCCAAFICHTHPSLQQGIQKLIRLLEGQPESQFNAEQYMMLYT